MQSRLSAKREGKGLWSKSSRQLLGCFGILGTFETAFLTYQKLVVQDLNGICPDNPFFRCGGVLNSEWANLFSIPLTLPAVFAYLAVAVLAFAPLLASTGSQEQSVSDLRTRGPLLLLSTSMATFSSYLLFLLVTQFHEACPWCLASAALTYGMAYLTWSGQLVPNATRAAVYKVGAILVTVLLSAFVYVQSSARILLADAAQGSLGVSGGGPYGPPTITTQSDQRSLRVADKLKGLDSRMYGAFWCSHCYEQKQAMGKQAFSKIRYIECSPDGVDSQASFCRARKVPGYPTWEIYHELYPGEKSLDELELIADETYLRSAVDLIPCPINSDPDDEAK